MIAKKIILCVHQFNNSLKLKVIMDNKPYKEYYLYDRFIITPTVIIKKGESTEEFKRINRQAIDYIRNHPDKLIQKLHMLEIGLTQKFIDAVKKHKEIESSSEEEDEYFGLVGFEPLGAVPQAAPPQAVPAQGDDGGWDPNMATPPGGNFIDYTTG